LKVISRHTVLSALAPTYVSSVRRAYRLSRNCSRNTSVNMRGGFDGASSVGAGSVSAGAAFVGMAISQEIRACHCQ